MNSNEALSRAAADRPTSNPESRRSEDRSRQLDGLVRRHHLELVRHVNRQVHSWNDAKDIVQQLWLTLSVRGWSTVTNLRAYLFQAARNSARDWNDKRQVRDTYAREEPLRAPALEISPEEICERRQELECLLRGIDGLPEQSRKALLLVRYEGLSLEEASVRLGVKPESVKKSVHRAMKYLAETVPLGSLASRRKS